MLFLDILTHASFPKGAQIGFEVAAALNAHRIVQFLTLQVPMDIEKSLFDEPTDGQIAVGFGFFFIFTFHVHVPKQASEASKALGHDGSLDVA